MMGAESTSKDFPGDPGVTSKMPTAPHYLRAPAVIGFYLRKTFFRPLAAQTVRVLPARAGAVAKKGSTQITADDRRCTQISRTDPIHCDSITRWRIGRTCHRDRDFGCGRKATLRHLRFKISDNATSHSRGLSTGASGSMPTISADMSSSSFKSLLVRSLATDGAPACLEVLGHGKALQCRQSRPASSPNRGHAGIANDGRAAR